MAARCITKISLLIFSICALISCDLGIEIPDYFIDVRTKDLELAYDDWSNVKIEFKFTAENQQHRCRYTLTNGSAVEFESELTDLLDAGIWHTLPSFNITSPEEGKYNVRVIVQSEAPDGQLIDLSFLNKAVVFYFDHTGPGVADIFPTPAISSQPIDVELSHPDDLDPDASPVTLYYTLDGTTPISSSIEYTSPFRIEVPDIEESVELQVIAVDCVDLSSSVTTFIYNFLDVKKVTNPGLPDPDPVVDSGVTFVVKELHGFGFASVDEVTVYDHDDTSVITSLSPISDILVRITINPDTIDEDPNMTGFEAGQGTIEITDNETGVIDTYSITIE